MLLSWFEMLDNDGVDCVISVGPAWSETGFSRESMVSRRKDLRSLLNVSCCNGASGSRCNQYKQKTDEDQTNILSP